MEQEKYLLHSLAIILRVASFHDIVDNQSRDCLSVYSEIEFRGE